MTNKPNGQRVGYIRVSTLDQNTIRQEEQLGSYQLDKTFIDKASGKSIDRPELKRCLEHLREGDTLIIHSMDRLARNLEDLRSIVKELTGRGVAVQFDKEGLTFTDKQDSTAQLMLTIMGAFAEFERSLIKERQREGIAIAKSKGAYVGRKKTLSEADVAELLAKDKANGQKNRTGLALEYGVSRETLYKYLRAAEASPAQEA
jgi:DNA invertase Pin-like site-specific DNA recombinase